jgi:AcrR family transcriptional regulator
MDTRKIILAAAERLIRAKGLARLTTKQIAQEAGVAEGSLFNHFSRKDDLVLAVILERVPQFLSAVATPGEKTVPVNLTAIARAVVKFYEGVLPVVLALFADAELLARHREAVRHRQGGPQYMMDVIIKYVVAEQGLGRVGKKVHPPSVASALCGACFQWAFVQQSTGQLLWPDQTADNFTEQLVTTLCKGLDPRDSRKASPATARKRT